MSNYKNFIYLLLFLAMQEFVFVSVFIFIFFSSLFFSIFYMKRKETDLNNKIIELEHELKMCKEELRIEKVKTRKLTFVMLTSKQ